MKILSALRHRNYRLYFFGQSVSLVGTWMQQTATAWLIYRLTGSPLLLGLAGFADKIPVSLIVPFAGVWIDRCDRHRIILVTQTLALLQALVLAVLVATGSVQVWHVLALAVLLGTINAFDIPGRQTFTIEIIEDKEDLGNAIALNSTVFNTARLLGPSLAGVLIASAGEAVCFFANAASFVPILCALMLLKLNKRPPSTSK
jgi:MFS family permease